MKIIPARLITDQLHQLRQDCIVLSRYSTRGSDTALAAATMQIEMLESVLDRGVESADDMLPLDDAIAWSGLTADALRRGYESEGAQADRRWRRGSLPCRNPYDTELVSEVPAVPGGRPNIEPVDTTYIDQAVRDALAAA